MNLVPFRVVSPNVNVEDCWSHAATRELLFSEYMKYLNALIRCTLGGLLDGPRPAPAST